MSAKAQVTPYHVHMHAWAHTHTHACTQLVNLRPSGSQNNLSAEHRKAESQPLHALRVSGNIARKVSRLLTSMKANKFNLGSSGKPEGLANSAFSPPPSPP